MGKGSAGRPMDIPRDEFEKKRGAIWPDTPKHCPACGYLPSWCICTDDGPGQEGGDAATEAKATYERRRLERN